MNKKGFVIEIEKFVDSGAGTLRLLRKKHSNSIYNWKKNVSFVLTFI